MTRPSPILVAGLATVALFGCTVGPTYHRPEIATAPAFADAAPPATPGAALSRVTSDDADLSQWWGVFNDAELSALVKRAFAGNLQLAEAVSRVRQAREQETVAGAQGLPSINGSGLALRDDRNASASGGLGSLVGGAGATTGASGAQTGAATAGAASTGAQGPSHIDYLSVGANATWQIDVFGGVRRGVESARAQTLQRVWQARDTQVTIAAQVAQDYLQLRLAQARLQVLTVDLKRQEGVFTIIRDRFQAGFVTDLDVNQQRTQLAQTQGQIPQVQAQVIAYAHAIATLLGEQPEALEAELAVAKPLPPVPPTLPGGLPSDLLRRRPDIRAAERGLASANAQIGVAVARLYPSFNLIGSGTFSSNSPSNLFDLKNASSLGLLNLGLPLFDGGSNRAQIRAAKAAREEAFLEYRRVVITALQESEDALARYAADQQRWASATAAYNAANVSFTIANQQYASGLTDFTPVYQAQGALVQLQDQLTQADAQLATDVVSLYRDLGGGWSETLPVRTAAAAS